MSSSSGHSKSKEIMDSATKRKSMSSVDHIKVKGLWQRNDYEQQFSLGGVICWYLKKFDW